MSNYGTGIPRIDQDRQKVFPGKAFFMFFTHQDWVAWVRSANRRPVWAKGGLEYVTDRYGY